MSNGTPEKSVSVELPAPLVENIEQRLAHTDFDDVNAYITFVLTEVLAAVADGEDTNYDAVDREEVESRLESLGYLSE